MFYLVSYRRERTPLNAQTTEVSVTINKVLMWTQDSPSIIKLKMTGKLI